ncbi:HAD family hydrolase [Streptomyces sp. NPDC020951]|uniref:HAD family hydrolase n=1 Tax=Streptomyces sp. NPDC020951 TaxID=3365104 RepID=UPI00378F30BF
MVTLINVTYWDKHDCDLAAPLAPHPAGHYPSWRLGFAKPDPQAVLTVAALHGVPASEVLHVGDDFACDVQGALAAGAQSAVDHLSHRGPRGPAAAGRPSRTGAHRTRPGHRGHPHRAGHLYATLGGKAAVIAHLGLAA